GVPRFSRPLDYLIVNLREPLEMVNFEEAIAARDLTLFKAIESQSTTEDKHSLLACQLAVRELRPDGYRYIEIGSHLGGSIQPHLLYTSCKANLPIDQRPQKQPE